MSLSVNPIAPYAARAMRDSGTFEKLVWRYGIARADLILSGKDPAFNDDLASWRAIGQRP